MTALSWQVQNYDLTWSKFFMLEQHISLQDLDHELIKPLWNESQEEDQLQVATGALAADQGHYWHWEEPRHSSESGKTWQAQNPTDRFNKMASQQIQLRADSRFVPSQWETALLCNDISHWLGASLQWALQLTTYNDVFKDTEISKEFKTLGHDRDRQIIIFLSWLQK